MAQSNKQKSKTKSKVGIHNLVDVDDDSEHELFYYAGNRIQLMKEVLKIIKTKKIKTIAPDFMKNLDIEEINSMLLEELLGISNKRLKRILNGENEDTSSSESEEEKPIDVISLDDISDSEDDFGSDAVKAKKSDQKGKKHKSKKVPKPIKKEKESILLSDKGTSELENEKLMSVLEILELQARARAIRSQLALENINKKQNEQVADVNVKRENSDDSDAIVVDSPKNEEIVITSSDSENEERQPKKSQGTKVAEAVIATKNVELVETAINLEHDPNISNSLSREQENGKQLNSEEVTTETTEQNKHTGNDITVLNPRDPKNDSHLAQHEKSDSENDDVVINLDIDEMEND